MLYREAGQFRTSYAQDSQILPLRQDRIGMAIMLVRRLRGHSHSSPTTTG